MDEGNGLGTIGQQKTWLHSAKRGPSPSLRVRRHRQCELIWALGAPALLELINELAGATGEQSVYERGSK